jgi:pyruvate dehydrogenase E2 component (dihydrolipoamide acetyltransferase)
MKIQLIFLQTMETGSIANWLMKEGEEFNAGQAICEVETDKATVTYEATEEGYIAKILVGTGELKVGEPMMVTVDDASLVSAFANFTLADAGGAAAAPAPTPVPAASPAPAQAVPTPAAAASFTAPVVSQGGRVVASPYARKMAREAGIDLSALPSNGLASGPNGRILAADVQTAITKGVKAAPAPAATPIQTAAPAPAAVSTTAFQSAASVVDTSGSSSAALASLFTHSKKVVPHYFLSVEIDLTKLMALREQLGADKVSVQDFLIKAAGKAMTKVRKTLPPQPTIISCIM